MSAYHGVAAHFPIALWATAFLIILLRVIWKNEMTIRLGRVVGPLILFATLMGLTTLVLGLLIWPWEATTNSPLARNHLMFASWAILFWGMLCWIVLSKSAALYEGYQGFIVLFIAAIGMGLVVITGTLGGELVGNPSALPSLLKQLGWNISKTFYVPTIMLGVIAVSSIAMIGIGVFVKRERY